VFDRERFGWQAIAILAILFVALAVNRSVLILVRALRENADNRKLRGAEAIKLPAPQPETTDV
jgi:hypothetical protein